MLLLFGLSLAFYDVVLFIILLRHFINMGAIGKTDMISSRYQIMIVNMLKN